MLRCKNARPQVLSAALLKWVKGCALGAALTLPAVDANACAFSVVDHQWTKDTSGIWNPSIYRGMTYAFAAAQVGAAVWEGTDSRLGNTSWKGIDADLITIASTEALRYATSRERPSVTNDPCEWSKGNGNNSFPSGEAAFAAALVTPYILEYGHEYPATYALLLFPLYVGIGRIKAQSHWQTDVLAGWALGGTAAYFTHERETPLLPHILPHGVFVGLKKQF